MPKSSRPAPIPDWLRPTLKRAISGEPPPDTLDFQIVSAALAGVELDALKSRFQTPAEEIMKSVLRVACAVREQRVEGEVYAKFPDLKALQTKRKREKKTAIVGPQSIAAIEAREIEFGPLPEIIPGDDESFHNFLMAAKAQSARVLVPATLRAMQRNMESFDGQTSNPAIAKSLEMFYGVGKRGPGVAIQQNFGQGADKEKAETPHFFEETILHAEVTEGSHGGETTVFDERLLGQQDSEDAV